MRLRPILILLLATAAYAQSPRIGAVEVYGNRKVPTSVIRKTVGVEPGGTLAGSRGDMEDRLESIDGVTAARVQAACCDDSRNAILYVGIQEQGAPAPKFHEDPNGSAVLPDEIILSYASFLKAVANAGKTGKTAEDLTRGHSLMADPGVRAIQQHFVELATKNTDILRSVLRTSVSEEQRAIAAYVIGYAPDKKQVLPDLLYAMLDSDGTVRDNAMRSLGAFAVMAHVKPESGLTVSADPFVELLNSVEWRDRHTACVNLVTLTDSRNAQVLDQLRARAMPSLIEMARWKQLEHALPAYILVGRVMGMPEDKMQKLWSDNNREVLIKDAETSLKPVAENSAKQ